MILHFRAWAMSLHFANKPAFQLLALGALIFVFGFWRMRTNQATFRKANFVAPSVSWSKRKVKITLQALVLLLMVASLARPQSPMMTDKSDHHDENSQENYQILLFWGVMIAISEMLIGERKGEGRIWRGRFEPTKLN